MRFLLLAMLLFLNLKVFTQPWGKITISCILIDSDSIPVSEAAIINIRTGKTVRSNTSGFFQTEFESEDSLMVYHIAYKRLFIGKKNNGRYIILEPEIQELQQVDVNDKKEQQKKNLEKTITDVRRLAQNKVMPVHDSKSRQMAFINENGSHNKGFSRAFGPAFHIPLVKLIEFVAGNTEQRHTKQLTSHYHLVKKKK